MSLSVGQVRIREAYKTLLIQWSQAREQWDDGVSREFEQNHIAPLEKAIKSAMAGMESLGEQVWRAQRECE